MNQELHTLFNELTSSNIQSLRLVYKNAPKMLLLIDFLIENKTSFKTTKVLKVLYSNEFNTTDIQILNNRYHKLRQELLEWLYHYLKKTGNSMSKTEQKLHFIQYLVHKNHFLPALEQALSLESIAWKNNLFELLPNILHIILSAQQSMLHPEEQIKETEQRLEKAIELHYRLQKLQYLYQYSYRKKTLDEYLSQIKKIRKLIESPYNYPRFQLIYHYTAFSRGSFVDGVVKKSGNTMTRHLNQIEKLQKEYPDMPFVFTGFRKPRTIYARVLLLKSVFLFMRAKYLEAYQAFRTLKQLKKTYTSIEFPESEPEIRNSISVCIGNQKFEEAREQAEQLKDFYTKNDDKQKLLLVLYERVNIAFFQFPNISNSVLLHLYEQVCKADAQNPYFILMGASKTFLKLMLLYPVNQEDIDAVSKIINLTSGKTIQNQILMDISTASLQKDKKWLEKICQHTKKQLKSKRDGVEYLIYKQLGQLALHFQNIL